jgi:MFS family permease
VAASLFFTTLYLQVVLGHSALFVGLAFGPITLMIMALAPVTAKVVTRHGARLPLLVGLVLTAGGTLLLSRISVDGSYWTHVLPGLLLIAAGSALSYVPTFIAATAEVPSEEQGAASGLINTSQEIGPAVGLAALAAVAATWSEGGAGVHGLVGGYSAGLVATAAIAAVAVLAAFWVPADLGRATPDARESDAAPGDASLEPSHSA